MEELRNLHHFSFNDKALGQVAELQARQAQPLPEAVPVTAELSSVVPGFVNPFQPLP